MKAFRQFPFLLLLVTALLLPQFSFAQKTGHKTKQSAAKTSRPSSSSSPQYNSHSLEREKLSQALSTVCSERRRDVFGSTPIDVMQSKPTMAINHPEALAGISRARRLLPLTRELLAQALQELGKQYGLPQWRIKAAVRRIQLVTKVKPDPELRDNAAVVMNEPDTISFGTIFLAGLPSDEGMISVLAHEMTHLADGGPNTLHPLFNAVGARATNIMSFRVTGQRAEELTCDLIGVMVARYLIERTPNKESVPRRLSRSLQHNCVDQDDTDEDHLSPRTTMRAIMALAPTLARDLLGITSSAINQEPNTSFADFTFKIERGTSLTISRSDSYHHRSQ